jgi:hypothetical protein
LGVSGFECVWVPLVGQTAHMDGKDVIAPGGPPS